MSANKSLRSKVESHFQPSKKALGKDLEDPVDIYDHTKHFFKKNANREAYSKGIEVGERRIKGIIADDDLDEKYAAKKVSRKQLESEDSEQQEEEGDDYDEEIPSSEYDEEEDGKEEDSDAEEEDQSMSAEYGEEESEEEERKVIKNKTQNDDDEDEDLDLALQHLRNEEKDVSKFYSKRISSEIEKAKSVKVQKKVFDQFLHQRILMQKLLTTANRVPSTSIINQFTKHSVNIGSGLLACKRGLKQYIKDSIKIQKELFALSETNVEIKVPEEDQDLPLDSIYKTLEQNFEQVLPFCEETIERWNNRTQLLKQNVGKQSQGSQSKVFNKSILEQVNMLMGDSDQRKKMIEKTQLKRDQFKILGVPPQISDQDERDANIYNDYDFYQALLKDFLAQNDQVDQENGQKMFVGEDDIYVDGADLGLTQKFLEKKKRMQEQALAQKKKEVDRRASKNRKIRYIVHEKIVNFMTPLDNLSLTDGKDNILRTLFGHRTQNGEEAEVGQKRKREDIIDDIKLI